MKLTAEDLIAAIQSARSLEKLQNELRNAMIESLLESSSSPQLPANTALPGAPPP